MNANFPYSKSEQININTMFNEYENTHRVVILQQCQSLSFSVRMQKPIIHDCSKLNPEAVKENSSGDNFHDLIFAHPIVGSPCGQMT
jgi:uncharacterized membrane protein (UPF0182 family)